MNFFSQYHPEQEPGDEQPSAGHIARHALFVATLLVVSLWLVKLAELEYQLDFSRFGLLPRNVSHLYGIFLSPFIHGSLEHLGANTLPVFLLTFTLFYFYRNFPYLILFLIYLLSGIFVWLGGREALHIGISGIIYGLAAFLFLSGVLSRNVGLLTISLVVTFLYGGLFWGIFPVKPEISWESHLWGAMSGFLLALIFRIPPPEVPEESENPEEADDAEWQAEEEDPESIA